jgi:hypothetical protein
VSGQPDGGTSIHINPRMPRHPHAGTAAGDQPGRDMRSAECRRAPFEGTKIMSKGRNAGNGETKVGIKVGQTGDVYYSRRYGGIDMHVSSLGGLLAVATEEGGPRPADRIDIDHLKRSGDAVAFEGIVPDGGAGEGPIRCVDIIAMQPSQKAINVSETTTLMPPIEPEEAGERHGPPSPQEQADQIASTFALEAVVHDFLSVRCAYEYYREAIKDLNRHHRAARIEPLSAEDFDRLVAVARFIVEVEHGPNVGSTMH